MTSSEPAHGATPKRSLRGERRQRGAVRCACRRTRHHLRLRHRLRALAPGVNFLVADALKQHRHRRDDVIVMLSARGVTAPIAAAGYQLPMQVSSAADAARLAVRMENDGATAWRAVVEHAETADDRVFASTALTESAVMATRWNRVLGAWPITAAFPGGDE